MKVLLSWLREFVEIDLPPEVVAEKLTDQGLEVESLVPTASLFKDIVVGEILSREPVGPDRGLLRCEVALGEKRCRTICGDPKVRVGQRVPVALPGATLVTGVTVEVAEIGGERSDAVLCSLYDLGLRSVQDEVFAFDGTPAPGSPVAPLLGLEDTLLEIELTPNRGDCQSVLGVAREIAAFTGQRVRVPEILLGEVNEPASARIEIHVEANDLCPAYIGRMVEGVEVRPSPLWLASRLRLMGLRPINNIVDVANYVMFELGQPLHTFDYRLLNGAKIMVRRGSPGERFEALDGTEHELGPETLVIADANRVVAAAGIVGGADSGVTDETQAVLIESAHFDPVTVRKGARRMGCSTEASIRFERGIDPRGVGRAADRTAGLLAELAGGTVLSGRVEAGRGRAAPEPISLRVARTNAHLGLSLGSEEMAGLLRRLEFQVTGTDLLRVVRPSYRNDVMIEADLVEEVARMYGYARIPGEAARHGVAPAHRTRAHRVLERTREVLCGLGLHEIVTATLGERAEFLALGRLGEKDLARLRLRNPFSLDQSVLRPSLIPGMLACLRVNLNRRRENVRLFEIGTVFGAGKSRRPSERRHLAAVLTGEREPTAWSARAERVGFFDLKGLAEGYFEGLRLAAPEFQPGEVPTLERGLAVQVQLDGREVGVAGRLEEGLSRAWGLREPVFLFELILDEIIDSALELQQFQGLARYPSVSRDLAVIVGEEVSYSQVRQKILEAGEPLLVGLRLFDVYRGEQIPEGKKSLACSLTFRLGHRTLRDEEVDGAVDLIAGRLRDELSASLRSEA